MHELVVCFVVYLLKHLNNKYVAECRIPKISFIQEDALVHLTTEDIDLEIPKEMATKAGPELDQAIKKVAPLLTGTAASTSGFNLCKQIIHYNCPLWNKSKHTKVRTKLSFHISHVYWLLLHLITIS